MKGSVDSFRVSKRQGIQRITVCLQVNSAPVYATIHFDAKNKKADADKAND
jgi:hypothetical protein